MQQLVLATNNAAKIKEITLFLQDLPLHLITLNEAGISQNSPEDGRTFMENAVFKAQFYHEKTGLACLADDGGIEIDALNGEPGVDSHRWISKTKDDEDEALIAYTFERMKAVKNRGAQMHLILALVTQDQKVFTTEGIVKGVIAEQPSPFRTPGFPFRSVFFIPELNKYYDHSVLTPEETQTYNHRRMAVEKMKPIIEKELLKIAR